MQDDGVGSLSVNNNICFAIWIFASFAVRMTKKADPATCASVTKPIKQGDLITLPLPGTVILVLLSVLNPFLSIGNKGSNPLW